MAKEASAEFKATTSLGMDTGSELTHMPSDSLTFTLLGLLN